MSYRHAAATMPRNIAAVLKGSTYGATAAVPAVSAAFIASMRDRDAREFWASATPTRRENGALMGSRYQGGSSVRARA